MASRKELANYLVELSKNTELLTATFEGIGLQVLQCTWKLTEKDDGSCECIVEVTGNVDAISNSHFAIKVNLYDIEGRIIKVESKPKGKEDFTGYDTFVIGFWDEGTLQYAKKARVYAVLGIGI